MPKRRSMTITVFSSFAEEEKAEHRRLAQMTPAQQCREFAIIQARYWGRKWTSEPMVKTATFERPAWMKR